MNSSSIVHYVCPILPNYSETTIMLSITKYSSLYWCLNVIEKQGHYSKLYVIGDDIYRLPPNKMCCIFNEMVLCYYSDIILS